MRPDVHYFAGISRERIKTPCDRWFVAGDVFSITTDLELLTCRECVRKVLEGGYRHVNRRPPGTVIPDRPGIGIRQAVIDEARWVRQG